MLQLLTSDTYNYVAVAVMLLAILFAYFKGRGVPSAGGQSPAWTRVPLIAFVIASIGPSAFAVLIYLGYRFGVFLPPATGYRFSTFITGLPFEFAVMNWGFVALYVTGRLWPNLGSARAAMWASVVVMALPNVVLFSLAWEMVSNVFDAGQGIGIIEATLSFPVVAMIWPGPLPAIFDAPGIGFVLSVLLAPLPILGLIGWLAVQFIGLMVSRSVRGSAVRS